MTSPRSFTLLAAFLAATTTAGFAQAQNRGWAPPAVATPAYGPRAGAPMAAPGYAPQVAPAAVPAYGNPVYLPAPAAVPAYGNPVYRPTPMAPPAYATPAYNPGAVYGRPVVPGYGNPGYGVPAYGNPGYYNRPGYYPAPPATYVPLVRRYSYHPEFFGYVPNGVWFTNPDYLGIETRDYIQRVRGFMDQIQQNLAARVQVGELNPVVLQQSQDERGYIEQQLSFALANDGGVAPYERARIRELVAGMLALNAYAPRGAPLVNYGVPQQY